MATDADIGAAPSVIDRLMDREPTLGSDGTVSRAQAIRELKKSLRRDLEWLLNTRRNPEAASPESMEQLANSVYNYGLPDFSTYSVNSARDRNKLMSELENALNIFEPRLKDIRISLVETVGGALRVLHFEIEGLLQMDPAPEMVSFDTTLQLASGEYQIRGERGA